MARLGNDNAKTDTNISRIIPFNRMTPFMDPTTSEQQSLEEKKSSSDERNFGPSRRLLISPLRRIQRGLVRTSKLVTKNPVVLKILGQSQLPPTKDGRKIDLDASRNIPLIDERNKKEYINNAIRSSRYTLLTFIPHQLWFQFSKIPNLYFLITGVIQLIPGLSTTGTYTTILPLAFFLLFTVTREGYDDFRRYQLDKEENGRVVRVLYGFRHGSTGGHFIASWLDRLKSSGASLKNVLASQKFMKRPPFKFEEELIQAAATESNPWFKVKWIHVKVGDIIELDRDEQVPADIILLHADGREGIAYVETMALDGETNLKSRHSLHQLKCNNLDVLSKSRAHFVVEDPNPDLYGFSGRASLGDVTLPLTLSNVILRGCIIRNTTRVFGMVINTGEECKIRMNANKNPQAKSPAIQSMTNKIVILLALFVIILASGCTVGYVIWDRTFQKKTWYLANSGLPLHEIWIAFAIMFNNLIPLALYVSLELIKLAQFILLADIEMYDEASNTPMVSNTQNIYEDLGQVNYILSDKTGTLTENVMQLRKMTIGGVEWKHSSENIRGKATEKIITKNESLQHEMTEIIEDVSTNISDGLSTPRITIEVPISKTTEETTQVGTFHEESSDDIIKYLQQNNSTPLAVKLHFFILSLAICHTCFPEGENSGKSGFQAASPDELALVEAAQDLGYLLIDRTTYSMTILKSPFGTIPGDRQTYEVLNTIEFSSKRKRMSIVVRFPDGRICLFCKGADSVLLPRFRSGFMAQETASLVQKRHLERVSMEVEEALARKNMEVESRKSFQRSSFQLSRSSLTIARPGPPKRTNSSSYFGRRSMSIIEPDLVMKTPGATNGGAPRRSMGSFANALAVPPERDDYFQYATHDPHDEASTLERCLEHIDNFASEGLRTLVYGYRFLEEEEYLAWEKQHREATTSLTNRQELIESAAEELEKNLDLAGATGIEDKLQEGVPETVEKLQQADIKIWMLTGDKRETAINIAHSAQLCKSYSEIVILDGSDKGETLVSKMSDTILKLAANRIAHSVIVIDGQTLIEVEANETLNAQFYSLLLQVDSVICCRASPSQKAAMVKRIRILSPKSITLAIGDGGNDIAMIQKAHVGIGISGKEGLQAARVADYSIAQFRFLQRLLLVHGHWLYMRTAKFILLTFWKEMLFYVVQLLYQRWNGYTGTSLFESWSLAVWNTLFTSLPVMIPGIFEQDLPAETLLAVPELYSYGQRNQGFNIRKYWWWMFMGISEGVGIYFLIYALYGRHEMGDQGLFALGNLAFSVCVVFINVKLLILDYQYLTWIPIFSALLTIAGWWVWNLFLSAAYRNAPGVYSVHSAFIEHFDLAWWCVLLVVYMVCMVVELYVGSVERLWDDFGGWSGIKKVWRDRGGDENGIGSRIGLKLRFWKGKTEA
ncbi:hypothetical protein HYALB_00001158 [Hymenoscyphus albidus]|uniref:Phospholipid-transporting ATPase n=1 Tax=Hymenoscyphus albidus TaxID=595503 RepID=A0A9N9LC21_9HELO|nr:hypothetical protein HYALB_00001158 [Hymenoscyphus albidus]